MEDEDVHVKVVEFLKGEFSVEEDLLLVDLLEYRRQPWEEFVRTYNKKKNQYSQVLTHCKDPHAELFRVRLNTLRTSPRDVRAGRHFHFLKKFCDRSANEKKEDREKNKLKRWHPDSPVGKRQTKKLGPEKLEIVLIGKKFPKTSITTYKKPLMEQSDLVKAMIDKSTEDGVITLSEKAAKYSNFDSFSHFHPDVVMRFILFCVNDVYSSQYETELKSRHDQFKKKMDEYKDDYYMVLDIEEKSHLRALAQQKREEQQKEWAHWEAGTPLAAFLNSPSPSTLPPSLTLSHTPSLTHSRTTPIHTPSHTPTLAPPHPPSLKIPSRSPSSLQIPARSPASSTRGSRNASSGNFQNTSRATLTPSPPRSPQKLTSRALSPTLVKSERFADTSFSPIPSPSNSSVDSPDATARNRKIQAHKFAKIKHTLQQHYKQQRECINNIVAALVSRHWQKMEDKKADSIMLLNYILQQKLVVRVLLLAEDLICEELRQICITKIASSIDKHINSEPLRCMLLREETYVSILAKLPVSTLLSIVPGSSIPSSIVSRELAYRKLLIKDKVENMSFDELRNLSENYDSRAKSSGSVPHEVRPFFSMIDIVKEDLAFRTETCPIVELETLHLPEGMEVESDKLTISAQNLHRYSVAHANHSKSNAGERKEKESEINGKWYFEVAVEAVDPFLDACISIGWDSPRPSLEKSIPGLTAGFDKAHGFCVQTDGIIHHSGKGEYFGPKAYFGTNDVIGCGFDQINSSLSFYKNGYKISSKSHHGNFFLKSPYELIPCVCFYSRFKSQVKFNFAGPFLALPLGFKPYGRSPSAG